MHNRTLCVIFMSMIDNILQEIVGDILALVMWKKLEELHSVKLLMNHLYLKKILYNL